MNHTKQNILLINQTFYPDKAATAQHLTDFAQELAGEGHSVTVLTSRRGYTDPAQVYSPCEFRQGIKIVRVWPFSFGKKVRLLRMLDAALLNFSFALKLVSMPAYDKAVVLTSPPLVAFAAAVYCAVKKVKLVYWVMDLNPDEAIAAGWIRKGSLAEKMLSAALKYALKKSKKIIALDKYMKDRIQRKDIDASKITVLPPWPLDTDLEYIPREKNIFLKERRLENKFIVMYSGNFSVCHPLATLLAAARLLEDDPDIVFLFVGGGARLKEILDFKNEHRLENVIHLPYMPRTEIKYSLSAADLHAVVMGEVYPGIVHPCKIYGILRLGIPFIYIGPEESHIGDLLKEGWNGFQVYHGNPSALAEIIRTKKKEGTKIVPQPKNFPFSREELLGGLKTAVLNA